MKNVVYRSEFSALINHITLQSEGTASLRPFSQWTISFYRPSENALRDLLFYKHKDIHNITNGNQTRQSKRKKNIWKHDDMSSQKSLTYDFPPDMNFNHFFSSFFHLYFDSINPTRVMRLWLMRRIILSHPSMSSWHLIRLMEKSIKSKQMLASLLY